MSDIEERLRQLMTAAQQGEKRPYRDLLFECEQWLRRYYSGKIAPSLVDDLVQDTLVSLHRKRSSYNAERPFLPWLAAIARYRWIDHLRKIYRAGETELHDEFTSEPEQEDVAARLSLESLFEHIPERQATVIRLVKIQGLSIAEASAQTGQSESLVKVNIHRGIKKMNTVVER